MSDKTFGRVVIAVCLVVLLLLALTSCAAVPPAIDNETLLYVLGGMLGLGTLRSVEKVKGAIK